MRGVFEVNLSQLNKNIQRIKEYLLPGTSYVAVLKADAYGFGLGKISKFLNEKVDGIGVANVDEASLVRKVCPKLSVLILSPVLPDEVDKVVSIDATPFVSCTEDVLRLDRAADSQGKVAECHIAVDTGMGREGVWFDEALKLFEQIRALEHLRVSGICTHLSSIGSDRVFSLKQLRRFADVVNLYKGRGEDRDMMIHASSSFGIKNFAGEGCNAVRIGALHYGIEEEDKFSTAKELGLLPIGTFIAFVTLLKTVPRGTKIGYDQTFQLKRDTRIALLSIGYADGVPVSLSNIGEVLIHGVRCKIIGKISMDQIMVDVSDLQGVEVGDPAVLFGAQGQEEITLSEFSKKSGLPLRACTCGISSRVKRAYSES